MHKPLTSEELQELNELAQNMCTVQTGYVYTSAEDCQLLSRALYELARLQTMDKALEEGEEGEDGSDPNS